MANETIIKAAGQAYSPVQGQYDISGFVQGVASIAQGLIVKKQKADKLKSSVDKLSVPTDIAQVDAIVSVTKQKIIDKEITMGDGVKSLKGVEFDVNRVIPKINSALAVIEDKGLSLSVDGIDENYTTSLKLGELNQPVMINGEEVDVFYQLNEKNELMMLSPDGEMVRPNVLLARLEAMTTANSKEPANALLLKMIGADFSPGSTSKFGSSKDAINSQMNILFEDKKVLYSFLLDNPNGFDITDKNETTINKKFTEHYIKSGMDNIVDENGTTLKDRYDAALSEVAGAEAKEKAQAMIIKRLMDDDPNLRKDVQSFLDGIYDLKKPGPLEVAEKNMSEQTSMSKFSIDLNTLDKSEKQDVVVLNSFENSMNSLKTLIDEGTQADVGDVITTAMGGKVQLVRVDDDTNGVAQYQYQQNMQGETEGDGKTLKVKRLGNPFSLAKDANSLAPAEYRKVMLEVMSNVPNGVSYGSTVYNYFYEFLGKSIPN